MKKQHFEVKSKFRLWRNCDWLSWSRIRSHPKIRWVVCWNCSHWLKIDRSNRQKTELRRFRRWSRAVHTCKSGKSWIEFQETSGQHWARVWKRSWPIFSLTSVANGTGSGRFWRTKCRWCLLHSRIWQNSFSEIGRCKKQFFRCWLLGLIADIKFNIIRLVNR